VRSSSTVRTGLIQKELAKLYDSLFDSRLEGDYQDMIQIEEPQVQAWIPQVKAFLDEISLLVNAQHT